MAIAGVDKDGRGVSYILEMVKYNTLVSDETCAACDEVVRKMNGPLTRARNHLRRTIININKVKHI